MTVPAGLGEQLDRLLAEVDARLAAAYPGERGVRQPVHTVYVPADRYDATTVRRLGRAGAGGARRARAGRRGGGRGRRAGARRCRGGLRPRCGRKLAEQPIEDLRIDLEDGYGARPDEEEDAAVRRGRAGARRVRCAAGGGRPSTASASRASRRPTRARGLRTLALFVASWPRAAGSSAPTAFGGHAAQGHLGGPGRGDGRRVRAGSSRRTGWRRAAALRDPGGDAAVDPRRGRHAAGRADDPRRRRAGAPGCTTAPTTTRPPAASPRSTSRMEHPAADHAKAVMQVAAAGTGVFVSDGSHQRDAGRRPADGARRLAAARAAGAPLARARLLPGLGPASGPAAEPVPRDVRLLPRGAARCRDAAARLRARRRTPASWTSPRPRRRWPAS